MSGIPAPVRFGLIPPREWEYFADAMKRHEPEEAVEFIRPYCATDIVLFAHVFLGRPILAHIVEAAKEIRTAQESSIMLCFPRGHSKSTMFIEDQTIHDVCYSIVPNSGYYDPRVLIVRETDEAAVATMGSIASQLLSGGPDGLLHVAFNFNERTIPQLAEVPGGTWNKNTIVLPAAGSTGKTPTVHCVGVGAALQGFHMKRVRYDDVVTPKNSRTPHGRLVIWGWREKCLTGEAEILTERGYVRIDSISESDIVIWGNSLGKSPPVEIYRGGIDDVFKIETRSGKSVRANAAHPFLVYKNGLKPRKLPLTMIKPGMRIAVPRETSVFSSNEGTYEDGLLIGYMLGDGCTRAHSPVFCAFPPTAERINHLVKRLGCEFVHRPSPRTDSGLVEGRIIKLGKRPHGSRWGKPSLVNPFKQFLIDHGIWGLKGAEKSLKKEYGRTFYQGFVEGLIETDGCVSVSAKRGQIEFANTSEVLCRQLQEILQRFGVHASVRCREQTPNAFSGGSKSRLWTTAISDSDSIRTFARSFKLFEKQEKLNALVESIAGRKSHNRSQFYDDAYIFERVVSVKPDGQARVFCLTMPPESGHMFIANGIISGNTVRGSLDPGASEEAAYTPQYDGDMNETLAKEPGVRVIRRPALNRFPTMEDFEPLLFDSKGEPLWVKLTQAGSDLEAIWPCPDGTGRCFPPPGVDFKRWVREHFDPLSGGAQHRSPEWLISEKFLRDPVSFSGDYMLVLAGSSDAVFKKDLFRFFVEKGDARGGKPSDFNQTEIAVLDPDEIAVAVQAWDFAFTAKGAKNASRNARTAVARLYRDNKNRVFCYTQAGQWPVTEIVKMAGTLWRTNPWKQPMAVMMEAIGGQQALAVFAGEGVGLGGVEAILPIEEVKGSPDKLTAIVESGLLTAMMNGRFYLHVDDREALTEFLLFTGGDQRFRCDIVDAARMGYARIREAQRRIARFHDTGGDYEPEVREGI